VTADVTIGIPTYNRERQLRAAVASALAQNGPEVEVVVSDNASTDGTEAFCREVAARDGRFHYVRQEHNRGQTANFTAALAAARTEYFMWLTDDDVLAPDYVSRCVTVLESAADVDLVAGRATLRGADGRIEVDVDMNLESDDPATRVLGYYRSVGRNSVFFGVARTERLRALPALPDIVGRDWLLVAALAFGGKVRTVDGAQLSRSAAGISDNLRRVARSLDLGPFPRTLPRAALAVGIARDLLRSPTYAPLRGRERVVLAARCSLSAAWRVGIRFHLVRTVRAGLRRAGLSGPPAQLPAPSGR